MYNTLLALVALNCIGVLVCDRFTGVQASPLWNQRRSSPWDPSQFVPLSRVMPGGQGVNYLSDLTENLADDMSSQISLGSQVVGAVGRSIEHRENVDSDEIERVSDIVGPNDEPSRVQDNDDDEIEGLDNENEK